ncbi:hypothetical protein G9F71_016340 [Clostridium sp. FP2]|uniref:hypothetical protein n=1 Tax=Clostridium sp. FP2 TaxID=2724481 RepID=UPI0013E8FAB1|nr:hypothetical protein [Clostridium sp. FP2]MBZ9624421.1 hypothetical protein [Clostridium sp. FP2]
MRADTIEKLIKEIEEEYVSWLKLTVKDYPHCCLLSSEVIGNYLRNLGYNVKVIVGKMEVEHLYNRYEIGKHAYIRDIDTETIFDFTCVQFKALFEREFFKKVVCTIDSCHYLHSNYVDGEEWIIDVEISSVKEIKFKEYLNQIEKLDYFKYASSLLEQDQTQIL